MANTTTELLEQAIARVRQLPEERQQAALDALCEIADEPYRLSLGELRVLRPALADAKAGAGLSDADTDELLIEPWA